MNRHQRLNAAHVALQDWADWIVRCLERSSIGYPSQSVEGRMMADGGVNAGAPADTIIPNVMMRPRIAKVDRIVRGMPRNMRFAVECKYLGHGLEGEKLRVWMLSGGKMETYYYLWDQARELVANALLHKPKKPTRL